VVVDGQTHTIHNVPAIMNAFHNFWATQYTAPPNYLRANGSTASPMQFLLMPSLALLLRSP
jgi:hypothetical protein